MNSLVAEHVEYARLEEEYTRTKIKNAVKNAANRKWAKGKLIMLEEDYDWDYYRTFQIIQNICSQYISSIILIPQRLHLEEPEEYKQAREDYLGWMDRIIAGVDLEDKKKVLSDDMSDDSPHPKKISNLK
ncbi:MAG: hypothetical protein PHY14_01895 [Candidatus Gracilibacteria bacterium]|nr:hypothetical protein [Candidatus Gracilibacteria bacterium]